MRGSIDPPVRPDPRPLTPRQAGVRGRARAAIGAALNRSGIRSKRRVTEAGRERGGASFSRGALYHLLKNRVYRGETVHKGTPHAGEHEAIIAEELWDAVVAKLAARGVERRRERVASGALLIGLICGRPIRLRRVL